MAMLNRLRRWAAEGRRQRRITALQIEVSTACQLACRYCPRTVAADWPGAVMPWELYERRIAPYFAGFEMVFLQGWGEPLTNPRFWDMVALAKQAGCQVGFVTNALLLDDAAIDRACELGVDLICFTFAGGQAASHEFYRAGADFAALTGTIGKLAAAKAAAGLAKPVIGVSFTMMRGNLGELADAVNLAAKLGVSQVTASHLDCIPSLALEEDAVFLNPTAQDVAHRTAAARAAAAAGLFFRAEPPHLGGEILVCEPYPLHTTLFIRVDGTVVPCHQMALPPSVVDHLYFRGERCRYEPVVFGNVADAALPDILAGPAARAVADCFGRRASMVFEAGEAFPEAPPLCRVCYKLYGA